jgi:hypothetical protein
MLGWWQRSVLRTGKVRQREHQAIQYSECHRFDGSANDAIMGRSSRHVEGASHYGTVSEVGPMSVQSKAERAAMSIEQTFRHSITTLATDTCEACARTINGTGFENIPAEQVGRLRLAVELAGRDQALIFRDTHKVLDFPHIFWAYFSLFQAAAATLIEVAYDSLAKIEIAQPELPDGWALARCTEQCEQVSKAIALWTQNATHPYAGSPWLAPSYLLELPRNGVWGNSNSSWYRLDEQGTGIAIEMLRTTFNLRLLIAAKDRYVRDLVAAAQEVPSAAVKQPSSPKERAPTKKTRSNKRHETIYDIIQSGVRSIEYCQAMDSRKVMPPPEWLLEGWPGSYVKAYKSVGNPSDRDKWQGRIQKEKTRHKNK